MKALFYFVDGFGWNYLGDRARRFTTTDWSQARPLQTVLGYSSSIVPVLLSGALPVQSGLWTEYYREDRVPSAVGSVAGRTGAVATPINMARLVAFRIARKAGWQGAHRLRIPIQLSHHFKRHPIDYMRMPPCAMPVPTIVDICERYNLRMSFNFIGHEQDAREAFAAARRDVDNIDVFFMYDCTIDHAGHTHGPDTNALEPYLDRLASRLAALRELVGNGRALETLVFSDHGMTAVDNSFDIFDALLPLRIGRDYLAFPDSTFARFWYPNHAVRHEVRDALRGAPGSFLTEDEARRYGVPFPDGRYGEDVLVANEGAVFHPSYISPSFFRTAFPDKGMHGYRPECASADGVVLYSGNVLNGMLPDRVPARAVFDLMSSILTAVAR
jgi:Type I phosphodiesterase / nucleotide pyrophosphatase